MDELWQALVTLAYAVASAGAGHLALTLRRWRIFMASISLHYAVVVLWAGLGVLQDPSLGPIFAIITRYTAHGMEFSFIAQSIFYWSRNR